MARGRWGLHEGALGRRGGGVAAVWGRSVRMALLRRCGGVGAVWGQREGCVQPASDVGATSSSAARGGGVRAACNVVRAALQLRCSGVAAVWGRQPSGGGVEEASELRWRRGGGVGSVRELVAAVWAVHWAPCGSGVGAA